MMSQPVLRAARLGLALLILNGALTFHNVWPTPWIRWAVEFSVEVALLVLALSLWRARYASLRRPAVAGIAALFVVFIIGHYAAVTAPALYGRDINLYWDSQHLSAVAGMLVEAAAPGVVIAIVLGAALFLCAMFALAYWSVRQVDMALAGPGTRRGLAIASGLVALTFLVQRAGEGERAYVPYSEPVVMTYATQVRLVRSALSGGGILTSLGTGPTLNTAVPALKNTDVFVFFIESYGATAFARPDVALSLATGRRELAGALYETGRAAVSAYVESPTFAGGSWLAHLSFMTGIEIRDPNAYAALMTQQRDTLATLLSRNGYRTVGLMPGIRLEWPEGAFYRFDALLDANHLDYRGPEFGWWRIPDQFALARVDELEFNRSARPPLFVLFTSITTHLPFVPTPPYQEDWHRILSADPFDANDVAQSLAQTTEWLDMGKDYARAMGYTLQTLTGYLRKNADRDFLMIVIGDHQPAANVTGEDASWDVPVHVIANRPALLAPLLERGFTPGLTPAPPSIGPMHMLTAMFTELFATPPLEAEPRQPPGSGLSDYAR